MKPAIVRITNERGRWEIRTYRGPLARVFRAEVYLVAGCSLEGAIAEYRAALRHLRAGAHWASCLAIGIFDAMLYQDWRERQARRYGWSSLPRR